MYIQRLYDDSVSEICGVRESEKADKMQLQIANDPFVNIWGDNTCTLN